MTPGNGDSITPHGADKLVDLKVPALERSRLRAYAEKLPTATLNMRDLADLEMLATGAFSPLTGYMAEADYVRSRDEMRLGSGLPWPIPITLGADETTARRLDRGQDVALATEDGNRVALLKLSEVYQVDRKLVASGLRDG